MYWLTTASPFWTLVTYSEEPFTATPVARFTPVAPNSVVKLFVAVQLTVWLVALAAIDPTVGVTKLALVVGAAVKPST